MAIDVAIAAVNEKHQILAGVVIEAYDADTGAIVDRATTGTNGHANFVGLPEDIRLIFKPQITRAGGGLHSVGPHIAAGTGVEVSTSTGGVVTIIVTGAGIDHGLLSGLADDDHTQYLKEKASGGTAAETPTHAHTGATEAGTLDHGAALTGLTDDDHTQYLKEKAAGGVAAEVPTHAHSGASEAGTVSHDDLTGVSIDDHHARDHASRHENGGADEMTVENMSTAESDTALVLHPDGAGGIEWGADMGSGGGGGGNGITTIVAASDEEETTTSLQDHNELTLTLDAASTYYFRFVLKILNDGSGEGLKLAVNGSVGVSDLKAQIYIWDDTLNTLVGFSRVTALDSTVGASLSSGNNEAVIEGSILTTTAGTFKLRFAQNASGASAGVHIQPMSSLVVCSDAVTTLPGATDATFAVFSAHSVLTNEVDISAKPFVMFGDDSNFSAEVNVYGLSQINEVKGWPPLVPNDTDLVTANQWFDDVATPTTKATLVDIAGEASLDALALGPFKSLYALKCITDANNEGWMQRWTYADEPRIASGMVMSCLVAIATTAGSAGITVKLVNSDASSTTGTSLLSSGDWAIFKVENHSLAGTYVELQVTKDTSGTFYAVPFSANLGARALFLPPRPLHYVEHPVPSILNAADLGGSFTDVDFTSNTSNLTAKLHVGAHYRNATTVGVDMKVRRNGDSTNDISLAIVRNATTSATVFYTGAREVVCDDSQIVEALGGVAGDGEAAFLHLIGYYEWG